MLCWYVSRESANSRVLPGIQQYFLKLCKFKSTMANISAIRNLANEGINLTKDVMGKVMRSVRGNDKRFFNSSKKGEVGEWKKQLHSLNVSEVTNAMKCVIAAMTIGTDVSMLFPDVISCIHDKTLELKKLVYL